MTLSELILKIENNSEGCLELELLKLSEYVKNKKKLVKVLDEVLKMTMTAMMEDFQELVGSLLEIFLNITVKVDSWINSFVYEEEETTNSRKN